MSDTPRIYRQGISVPLPFPPHLHLELRGLHDAYLILPHSIETQELHRFMMIHHDQAWKTDPIGEYRLDHLLDDLKNGHSPFGRGIGDMESIRRFYTSWRHVQVMETDRALVDRIKYDIKHGSLVVFRFERDPHWGMIRKSSLEPVSDPNGPVATWSGKQKVVALFRDIPDCLTGAAKAEFEAFLTPTNLAVMAAFLGGIAIVQAIPGADAVVDTMIAGLAWWQFGWAGVIAAKNFVEAVVEAGRATNRQEIMLAAKLAAAALVSLGLTLLLRKIVERVHDVRWSDDGAGDLPAPKSAPGSTNDMMDRYRAGNKGVSYPRVDKQFAPESSYDPANLTADQKVANDALENQGWDSDKIDQVLNSGSNFETQTMYPGDPVFKIGNAGLDPAGSPSPYLLNGDSYNALVGNGSIGDDGSILDRAGIKQTLALPCYNLAQNIFSGTINSQTTAVVSNINPASELFNLDDGTGSPLAGKLFISGGGSQASIDPDAINW